MLELREVHAGYGHTPVLKGVSLRAAEGGITALLGRNGMGKTTTVDAIIVLVDVTSGSVLLTGRTSPACSSTNEPCLVSGMSLRPAEYSRR